MAENFGFYDHAFPHHGGEDRVDEEERAVTVYTDRGDAMRARFVILANGILRLPKLAGSRDGDVQGRVVPHIEWAYIRRPPRQAGWIIGTGVTAVQVRSLSWPRSSRSSTSSTDTLDDRRARPTGDDCRGDRDVVERAGLGPRPASPLLKDLEWPHRDPARTTPTCQARCVSRKRKQHERKLSTEELVQKQLNTNFRIMELDPGPNRCIVEIQNASLKPYYPYGLQTATSTTSTYPLQPTARHAGGQRTRGVTEINEPRCRRTTVRICRWTCIYATGPVDGRRRHSTWSSAATADIDPRNGVGKAQRRFSACTATGSEHVLETGTPGGGGSFNFTEAIDNTPLHRLAARDDAA